MLRKAENVFSVLLNDVEVVSSTLPAVGTVITNQNLPTGAIVLTDIGNRRTTLASLANGDSYFIVQGKGTNNPLMKSPKITKGTESITTTPHKPAVQQITALGYNGTSGNIPSADNTSYYVKIRKNDNDRANQSQSFSIFAQYKTSGNASQEELAYGTLKNGIKNMSIEPANGYLRYEVLCNNAGAAVTGTVTEFGVTYGSTVVTLDGSVTNIAVGDSIRLGGTGTEFPVYKVAAVDSPNTITLTAPYQGETASILVAETRRILASAAITADFGIRLRGVQANFNVNDFRNYYTNRFTASFSDSDTIVTHLQGAYNGSGVWQQVAMDEYMSYGFEGQNEMMAIPPRPRDQEVKIPNSGGQTSLTSKYSLVNISWEESINNIVSASGMKGSVLVYLNLKDDSGSGILDTTTANNGETFAAALGLTPSDLNE